MISRRISQSLVPILELNLAVAGETENLKVLASPAYVYTTSVSMFMALTELPPSKPFSLQEKSNKVTTLKIDKNFFIVRYLMSNCYVIIGVV